MRLGALEDRIEAELALGEHARLVGELEALAVDHPLRERLHVPLMRALYAAGRQAEALAAYQRVRRGLAEQAGLDPGVELRRVEEAILAQDPSLHAAPAAPEPVASEPAPTARRGRRWPCRAGARLRRRGPQAIAVTRSLAPVGANRPWAVTTGDGPHPPGGRRRG